MGRAGGGGRYVDSSFFLNLQNHFTELGDRGWRESGEIWEKLFLGTTKIFVTISTATLVLL